MDRYGDGVLGIYKNEVVSAFDVTDWTRGSDGRVTFTGSPSVKFGHLIGTPNPGKPWVRPLTDTASTQDEPDNEGQHSWPSF